MALPAIDEEILRDLMQRATGDLHAPPAITTRVVTRSRRRHLRTMGLSVTAAGLATATTIGLVAAATGGAHRQAPTKVVSLPNITLTAAQRALNKLSLAAARTAPPAGRYVEMSELQGSDKRTSVIDSQTGDIWTFQQGQGIPSELPVYKHWSPTLAQFNAYPTGVPALRALLIKQAEQQAAAGRKAMLAQLRKDQKKLRAIRRAFPEGPKETANDLVFAQATLLLWNPLVPPSLRAALFEVLAATPGVVVNSHAKDSLGRPAVQISRYDSASKYTNAIYESPDATRVLETASIYPATKAHDGVPAQAASVLSDTYQAITWVNSVPANPYGG
jgi:hypothetical protein